MLVLDRYEVGERQTSACAAPTEWLTVLGARALDPPDLRLAGDPHAAHDRSVPAAVEVLHFRLPGALRDLDAQNDAGFDVATVTGRVSALGGDVVTVQTDRGEVTAPLVVDALGWRRVLGGAVTSRRTRRCRAGSRCTRPDPAARSRCGSTARWSPPATAGASRRVTRCASASGSFDPRFHVKKPTVDLAERLDREVVRYQGNWIPHRLRAAAEGDVFFVGDSAGHCLPLTAEGIRPALYFGIALGRELRRVLEGRSSRDTALRRYGAFSGRHSLQFEMVLQGQRLLPARATAPALRRPARDGERALHELGVRALHEARPPELRRGRRTPAGPAAPSARWPPDSARAMQGNPPCWRHSAPQRRRNE